MLRLGCPAGTQVTELAVDEAVIDVLHFHHHFSVRQGQQDLKPHIRGYSRVWWSCIWRPSSGDATLTHTIFCFPVRVMQLYLLDKYFFSVLILATPSFCLH